MRYFYRGIYSHHHHHHHVVPLLYNYGMIFYEAFSLIIFYHSVWLDFELFGLVQVQVHTLSTVHARAQRI